MTKTSVDIDRDIARAAAEILGTTTLRATIDAALREVLVARPRIELIELLSRRDRFDFQLADDRAWGGRE